MKTRFSIVLLVTAVSSLTTFTASGHPSSGIVVDQQGNVFFSNMSHGVLKIDPQGKVTTVSKEGGHWLALDTDGSFSKVDFLKSAHWPRWFKRRTPDGARPALITDGGSPLVVASDGSLYYVCNDAQMIPGGLQLARLTPDGKVIAVLKAESPWSPCGVALHGDDLYVLEHVNSNSEGDEDWQPRVRRVGRDGKVTTLVAFAPQRR